mmetsp:Transcript_15629/g.16889  ORF Transcript_15629/g.16889 Transcript_15629/m.16889 type:complete len:90 (-) Transcript_15629:240-509(-)
MPMMDLSTQLNSLGYLFGLCLCSTSRVDDHDVSLFLFGCYRRLPSEKKKEFVSSITVVAHASFFLLLSSSLFSSLGRDRSKTHSFLNYF